MKCRPFASRSSPLTRRAFLTAVAAGAAAAGCRRRQQSITVFVYSGLDQIFQEHFVAPFEARTGVKVVLDAGWWDAIGKLKSLWGADFDREYMKAMVADHEESIALYERQASAGRDPELEAFASKTLPSGTPQSSPLGSKLASQSSAVCDRPCALR